VGRKPVLQIVPVTVVRAPFRPDGDGAAQPSDAVPCNPLQFAADLSADDRAIRVPDLEPSRPSSPAWWTAWRPHPGGLAASAGDFHPTGVHAECHPRGPTNRWCRRHSRRRPARLSWRRTVSMTTGRLRGSEEHRRTTLQAEGSKSDDSGGLALCWRVQARAANGRRAHSS
jgi:hypothetical protein